MLLKNTEGKKDTDMEMTVASADLLADLIEKGLQEENMLIEALMCFIETESHLDLIPVISSRLPSVQFTSGYWNDKGPYCWNPVFSAVMHCSGIEVFRALRDADFPIFPVVDLRFYPDPEGFLEIIGMNMPDGTGKAELYELAAKRILEPYKGNEVNLERFYLSSNSTVSAEKFDVYLSNFIIYGRDELADFPGLSRILFAFFYIVCLNKGLERSGEALLSWSCRDRALFSFSCEEIAELRCAAAKAGNDAMYDYIQNLPGREEIHSEEHVLSNDNSIYSNEFIENRALKSRKAIIRAIYCSLDSCCPDFDTLSFLFSRLGGFRSSDFPESLTAVLVRNRNFRFQSDNYRKVLDLLIRLMPHDLMRNDKHGMNAFLYAGDDTELIKYIVSNEPDIMWSVDSEGRNIFHYFFCDGFAGAFTDHQATCFRELCRIVPSELLDQADDHGKLPFDYPSDADLSEKLLQGNSHNSR